jgi:hypothetical protein
LEVRDCVYEETLAVVALRLVSETVMEVPV